MNEKLYCKIADALVCDGYVVIDNAFGNEFSASLLATTKEKSFKKAGISGANELHIDSNRRRDSISWLENEDEAQSKFLNFSDGLKEYLNRELYLGLSYYEAHFALYDRGDFYEKHLDTFKNSKNCVVTTVYYLNEDYQQDDGGELIVYNESDKEITRVSPKSDILMVFMSEKFPHEVLPAKKKCYSIAGWFRIDKV